MGAPKAIVRLVELFERNYDEYKSGKYNETQLRREFLDPFFSALGWDVANKRGIAEQYKEVIHEDSIKVSGTSKAPDYCFRIGAERKFFVEAKKPSVNIKESCHPAFQVRRYAWSANLPLSILTDFDELAVYDCRVKPNKKDKASVARIQYYTYRDYVDKWDEIAEIFSRDAIWKGSFDKYVKDNKKKRGTAEVDNEFLKELESWRIEIAKNLALRNQSLSQRELNYSVQRTIDRILFLRISEDRGIEKASQLQEIAKNENVYSNLCDLFKSADEKYNSGLFHFHKEHDRPEPPDELSLNLHIDDKPLKSIINNIYYPNSPYEFSVMPAEILGQVYEQFLGKTIHLTKSNRIKIEEKPIVKKSGGVYYTPSYIVDEIVKEVVEPLLVGKNPKKVEKVKIIDPACGSGSFLIGVYDYLLEWHRLWYIEDSPRKHRDKLYLDKHGEWALATGEKKKILLNNIFGVDIDAQAVETTKLSLLLRVLEGETQETITKQLSLFNERALPDLGFNIKCGNSLVDAEFYNIYQFNMFNDEQNFKINAFNWTEEFPSIFKRRSSGFDAVVGNPPYVRIQILQEIHPYQAEYFSKKFQSAQKGNYDLYVTFVEKGLEILNNNGRLGYILPHKFMNSNYGEPLRQYLSQGKSVSKIVHFGDQQVFPQATTYTCLLYLSKKKCNLISFEKVIDLNEWRQSSLSKKGSFKAANLSHLSWELVSDTEQKLLSRLREFPTTLESETKRIFQGFKTGADKVFITEYKDKKGKCTVVLSKEDNKEYLIESELLYPLAKGGDSKQFTFNDPKRLILFPYKKVNGKAVLIDQKTMKKRYPNAWSYLNKHKKALDAREKGKWKGPKWYMFSRNQALDIMLEKKLFTPDIAPEPSFSIDPKGKMSFPGGAAGGYGLLLRNPENIYSILGILNSKLIEWYIRNTSTQMRGGFFSYESKYIKNIPLPLIDKEIGKKLSEQVEAIVDISTRIKNTRADASFFKRRYLEIKKNIDNLVFEIFELSPEEIELVENEIQLKLKAS